MLPCQVSAHDIAEAASYPEREFTNLSPALASLQYLPVLSLEMKPSSWKSM